MAAEERRLWAPLYVEPWFSADVKLGSLAVTLETPKCFAAEAYARERRGACSACALQLC